jgi:phage virion morphogenesis protein
MASYTIEINDRAFLDGLTELRRRGTKLRPLFAEIGAELQLSVRRRFDSETDPDGKKWDPISEAWRKQKEAEGKPTKVLHYNLDLRDSFTLQIGDDELVQGTNVLYARVHQLGNNKPGKRGGVQRARPFMGLSKDDRDFIAEATRDYLTASFSNT